MMSLDTRIGLRVGLVGSGMEMGPVGIVVAVVEVLMALCSLSWMHCSWLGSSHWDWCYCLCELRWDVALIVVVVAFAVVS